MYMTSRYFSRTVRPRAMPVNVFCHSIFRKSLKEGSSARLKSLRHVKQTGRFWYAEWIFLTKWLKRGQGGSRKKYVEDLLVCIHD